jgi:isopentenyl-diphosphate delta-isomerase
MDEEDVDIVDENDRVLYSAAKSEAHKQGLLHRTVIAEVRDSKGHWIMVEQAADRQDAGQLVSHVGGHVKSDETEVEALKREALEEIGIKDFEFKLVGKVIYRRTVLGRDENHYFILYEIHSDQQLTPGDEAVGFTKFTEGELKNALAETPDRFGAAFFPLVDNFYPQLRKVGE